MDDLTAALEEPLERLRKQAAQDWGVWEWVKPDAGELLAAFLSDPRTVAALARAIYAAEDGTRWELNVSEEMLAAAILAALRESTPAVEEALG